MDIRDAIGPVASELLLELSESPIAQSLAKSYDGWLNDKTLARNLGGAHRGKAARVLDNQFPHPFLGGRECFQCGHDLVKHCVSFARVGE